MAGRHIEDYEEAFEKYLDLITQQAISPANFGHYHERLVSPFNYHQFGLKFFRPLIDFAQSTVLGIDNVDKICQQLNAGDNVFLLANHQTEIDPQIIDLLLERTHPQLSEKMIFMAGHRVTTDPMGIPFSLGYNLLCIHSKKHLDNDLEHKQEKLLRNRKTMHKMRQLLERGGACIYIAPSGGRDRPNKEGVMDVATFDPPSLEMAILQAKEVPPPTHFYSLALLTYWLLPPPDMLRKELGEPRKTTFTPVYAAFGSEIDINDYPGNALPNKKLRRCARAEYIHSLVKQDYELLKEKHSTYKGAHP